MLKAAIVGCGRIADAHAFQITDLGGELVWVCDREPLMARQLYERFPVQDYSSDLTALLATKRPDVVHITTPPPTHFSVARECLEHGCHVYVEKPFTLDGPSAEALIALADERGLKVTVGHDDQFRHSARRMRRLVREGYLGGPPLHMESYYGYDLSDARYARSVLKSSGHWVRSLPGGLLHNIISHGIARIAEFVSGDGMSVMAHGFTSPMLKRLGGKDIIDELRVIISEQERVTAYFTFSSQLRPSLHQFRVYGARNGLLLDQDSETLVTLSGHRHKSVLEQLVPPAQLAQEYLRGLLTNVRRLVRSDLHPKAGLRYLIESFYRSIREDAPVPIPYREILLTARIMDRIFHELRAGVSAS
jgi:predicted dehydrogenase